MKEKLAFVVCRRTSCLISLSSLHLSSVVVISGAGNNKKRRRKSRYSNKIRL